MINALPRLQAAGHDNGLFFESFVAAMTQTTDEARDGLRAFLEKRAERIAPEDQAEKGRVRRRRANSSHGTGGSAESGAGGRARTESISADLSDIAGFVVHLTNLLLYRDYYERFAGNAAGLTLGAISVMAVIDANPGIRQGAAAEALLIKRSNMTKLVNRLERQGLVRRRASGQDRQGGRPVPDPGRPPAARHICCRRSPTHDAESTAPLNDRERRMLVGSARQGRRRQARLLNRRPVHGLLGARRRDPIRHPATTRRGRPPSFRHKPWALSARAGSKPR